MKCLICRAEAVYGDLCKDCWLGLKYFHRNTKLLGRAISYVGGKCKLITKHQRRAGRKRRIELSKLISEQRKDETQRDRP